MSRLDEAVAAMQETPPVDWWRFVPCALCRARRREACMKGGASWPEPARAPHAQRQRDASTLHGTIWLISNGFADDVLGDVR